MARARQTLERSRARDWSAMPQPEVVAELERLQALLGAMIAAAEPSPEFGGSTPEKVQGVALEDEGREVEPNEQVNDDAAEEEEGWFVTKLLFG